MEFPMKTLWRLFGAALLLQKIWKHWLVWRFFKRPIPPATRDLECVSILQPILSGDPTLRECLEANLAVQTCYNLEFIWLIDEDDLTAQKLCRELAASSKRHPVRILTLPPPGE